MFLWTWKIHINRCVFDSLDLAKKRILASEQASRKRSKHNNHKRIYFVKLFGTGCPLSKNESLPHGGNRPHAQDHRRGGLVQGWESECCGVGWGPPN